MVLQDSLGQTTYVRFKNVKVNASIPASVFNFTPPKVQMLLTNNEYLSKSYLHGSFFMQER